MGGIFCNKKCGFTLLELIMVVIILGVLAAVAIPRFLEAVENARSSEAITNLGTIRRAMQRYWLNQLGETGTGSYANATLDDLDIDNPNNTTVFPRRMFTYDFQNVTASGYTARARKVSSPGGSTLETPARTITIDQDGVITKTGY